MQKMIPIKIQNVINTITSLFITIHWCAVEVKFSLNVYICAHILIACHRDVIYLFYFHATHFYFISYLFKFIFYFLTCLFDQDFHENLLHNICTDCLQFLSLEIMWC